MLRLIPRRIISVLRYSRSTNYANQSIKALCVINQSVCAPVVRHKSKSRKSSYNKQESDEEAESDDLDNDIADKNSKVMVVKVQTMRLDAILKTGLGIARNKIDILFYESRIRLNGGKVLKKSAHVDVGDEIDIVKGPNASNPKFLTVARVEVLNATGMEDHINLKIRRCKTLTVENYDEVWKPISS